MIEVKVRAATHRDVFEEGDQLYLARGRIGEPARTLVVEPITITRVRETHSSRGFGREAEHYSYKHADWLSATGTTSGFTFASTEEKYAPNFKTEILIPDENGETVLCYERIGTAVTVTVLVSEPDPEIAKSIVLQALAESIADHEQPTTKEAFDRTEHAFDWDGRLLGASIPVWHSPFGRFGCGMRRTAEGCEPVHEVQYEIMKDNAEREAEMNLSRRGRRRGRPPGSKNKPKSALET